MSTPFLEWQYGDALPVLAVLTTLDTRTGRITTRELRTRRSVALCRRGIHVARKERPWVQMTMTMVRDKHLKAIDVAPDEKIDRPD